MPDPHILVVSSGMELIKYINSNLFVVFMLDGKSNGESISFC